MTENATGQMDDGLAYVGKRHASSAPKIPVDPHGITEVFAETLEAGLKRMDPEAAAKNAMVAVDSYLKSSTFIDMGSKSTRGGPPQFVRVDKKPDGGVRR